MVTAGIWTFFGLYAFLMVGVLFHRHDPLWAVFMILMALGDLWLAWDAWKVHRRVKNLEEEVLSDL